jgi:hypothetical protein
MDADNGKLIKLLQIIFGEEGQEIRKGSRLLASLYDSVFETDKWRMKLPYLSFPPDWEIRIIPPSVSAIIRFHVRKKETLKDDWISIYFDGYNNLGFATGPYWEIYPNNEGDNQRFLLGEEKEMIEAIQEALDGVGKSKE